MRLLTTAPGFRCTRGISSSSDGSSRRSSRSSKALRYSPSDDEVSGDTPVTTAWTSQAVALFWSTLTNNLSDDEDGAISPALFSRVLPRDCVKGAWRLRRLPTKHTCSRNRSTDHTVTCLATWPSSACTRELRRRYPAAADPDFFLVALVAHFFGDIEFARRALATDDCTLLSVQKTIAELCTTTQDKWDALICT